MQQDPQNAEYRKLFDKAREKYEDAEGKKLDLAVLTTPVAISTAQPEPKPTKAVPVATRAVASSSSRDNSRAVSRNNHQSPAVSCTRVKSLYDLLLPKEEQKEIQRGMLVQKTREQTAAQQVSEAEAEERFVQIPIQIDDDEEEEEDEERGQSDTQPLESGFVRIAIEEEDDDEEEENEDVREVLTEIERELGLSLSQTKEERALVLKDCGNTALLRGDKERALTLYNVSLSLHDVPATRNNRAQAKLLLQVRALLVVLVLFPTSLSPYCLCRTIWVPLQTLHRF